MAEDKTTLVWFRRDLRLSDHEALIAAAERGRVVPVYIWSPDEEGTAPGAASRWWLHESLVSLEAALRAQGLRLILRSGPVLSVLATLVEEVGADGLVWHRCYEPEAIKRDRQVKDLFRQRLPFVASYPGYCLIEPWNVMNQSGRPFKVFTAFRKRCLREAGPGQPKPVPSSMSGPTSWPVSENLSDWKLLPQVPWTNGMAAYWQPGEAGGEMRLRSFVKDSLLEYLEQRNRPDRTGTSRLSPYLHFGELSIREVWSAVERAAEKVGVARPVWLGWQFVAELYWREFAAYLLFHFPETVRKPLRPEFSQFPWAGQAAQLVAWQKGQTGYPIVDAGMRELWHRGWMHNRVRMIVASFLIKHLLVPWQEGAEWFWDTLVDGDLASNTLGWQWTAGCGADAAPYFRIFNPMTQGEKFDPVGGYVRQWVPEIGGLPDRYLHQPWTAPHQVLVSAAVELGVDYPHPIVDHSEARQRALAAYAEMRERAS